jgi:hypothetical protein
MILAHPEQPAFLVRELTFHIEQHALLVRASMRTVVVVTLHRHELHVEEAVVILLCLARAQQALVARPEEKFAEDPLIFGFRVAFGDRQQVVVIALEMRLAAGVQ